MREPDLESGAMDLALRAHARASELPPGLVSTVIGCLNIFYSIDRVSLFINYFLREG